LEATLRLALAILGTTLLIAASNALEANAQTKTCTEALGVCRTACKDAVASANCPSWCADAFKKCKSSGCFPKAARFGGGETCGFKKT
jgi:hypothetical protein